jgi:hypothetical protein
MNRPVCDAFAFVRQSSTRESRTRGLGRADAIQRRRLCAPSPASRVSRTTRSNGIVFSRFLSPCRARVCAARARAFARLEMREPLSAVFLPFFHSSKTLSETSVVLNRGKLTRNAKVLIESAISLGGIDQLLRRPSRLFVDAARAEASTQDSQDVGHRHALLVQHHH